MKTRLFSILCLALGSLSLAACQKDSAEDTAPAENRISRSFSIDDRIADAGVESRTAYDPGTDKIVVTGDEKIHVFYKAVGGDGTWGQALDGQSGVSPAVSIAKAADGALSTTFNHSGAAASYGYVFLMSYGVTKGVPAGMNSVIKLPSVQHPKSDTFDSNADILAGQYIEAASTSDAAAQIQFMRLFVPFRLTLVDADGQLAADKIKSVSFTPAGADAALAGDFNLTYSATAADVAVMSAGTDDRKSLTASYADGLVKNAANNYDVWYLVNPTTLRGKITVVVTTDKRTLTCTVTPPSDPEIVRYKINTVTVRMTNINTEVTANDAELEAIYDGGGSFQIGNVTINNTAYAKQTAAPGATLPSNAEGIYFLSTGVYTLPSNLKDLVLIAKQGEQVTVNTYLVGTRKYTQISRSLICRGVKLVAQNTGGYSLNNGSAGTAALDNFVLENCRVEMACANTVSLSYFANVFRNVVWRNNLVVLSGEAMTTGSANLLGFGGLTATVPGNQMLNVELVDNIIYSAKDARGSFLIMNSSVAPTDNLSVVCERNTFIRYYGWANPLITVQTARAVSFRNNLIWTGTATGTNYGLRIKSPKDDYSTLPILNTENNGWYGKFTFVMSGDLIWKNEYLKTPTADELTVDPFTGGEFNETDMIFIPADAYKKYGAWR